MRKDAARIIAVLLVFTAFTAGAQTITLTFIGDTSIGDAYQYRGYSQSYHSVIREKGMDWPFSQVRDVLLADDLTVANLEGSMTTLKKHRDVRYPLVIDPSFTEVLKKGGVDIVNTANNHAMDFLMDGYQETLATLDKAGIAHFGTLSPPKVTKADRAEIVEIKGIRIGFIGYTYPQDSDLARVENACAALREQGCALVILSLHWGRETYMQPNSTQTGFAKKALDAGVDMIYGHHPHVVQPIALYKGKPVLFSTGNFTFGTMSHVDRSTGMFQVVYQLEPAGPVLSKIRVIPCLTTGTGDYRPQPVTDEAGRLDIFRKLSFQKPPKGFTALPESFLMTGEADFIQ